ncbi:hypothetical protein ES705_46763 [subsurface metagenome]
MDKVAKVHNELYEKAKELAKAEDITIADAITRLVEQGGITAPSVCQLANFDRVLREQGLTPPRRPDWVWGVTDVLPAEMLAGTKLEPYARARTEAELRCAIGDELYTKLITGELTDEERLAVKILAEPETPVTEPETPVTEEEPAEVTD